MSQKSNTTLNTVTTLSPGVACDSQLPVTGEATILAAARPFTCRFPSGKIAVIHVIGGTDEQARAEISQAFVCCSYSVEPGDPTNDHAEPFYLWVCQQSQQQPQDQKRNREMLRNVAAEEEEVAASYAHKH
jgi:hypothetical protein